LIEPQIIKSKKANSYVGYSRTRESEIMDLIAHKKWLDDYDPNRQKAHDFSRGMNAVFISP